MSRRAQLDQWAAEFIASLDPRDAEAAVYQLVDYANAVDVSWVGFDYNHRYLARRRRDGAGWMVIRPDHTEVPAAQVLEQLRVRRLSPITTSAAEPAKPNKLTLADIEAEIASEHYFTAAQALCGYHPAIAALIEKATSEALQLWDKARAAVDAEVPPQLRLLTFCVLVLQNGHKAVGINHGPVDPAEFNAERGRQYAREDAIAKLWEPLGFRLRDQMLRDALSRPALTEADAAADLAGTPRPDFGLQPHEQRVIAEHAELVSRMKKLTAFRLGARAETLPEVERDLLQQQEDAMARYAAVLSKRIARFGQTVDPCTCGPGSACSNCPPSTGPAAAPSRVITPTVGRKVWFYSGNCQTPPAGFTTYPGDQACDATVVFVHNDRMVNLLVIDHIGRTYAIPSVRLVQPGDAEVDARSHRAEWMPYQVKQANGA